MPDNNSVKGEISVTGEWTIERVKKSLPQESRTVPRSTFL